MDVKEGFQNQYDSDEMNTEEIDPGLIQDNSGEDVNKEAEVVCSDEELSDDGEKGDHDEYEPDEQGELGFAAF
jgi:hypothetical protein